MKSLALSNSATDFNLKPLPSLREGEQSLPPDIKRRRAPAPGIGFDRPNLTTPIAEIERTSLVP